MGNFLFALLLLIFGYLVYHIRKFLNVTIRYKEARAAEVKRRLQVEHKNEQTLKQILTQPLDDMEKLKIEVRAAHERHQRAIHYVIEDVFERWQ
jgi:hypothetical protein